MSACCVSHLSGPTFTPLDAEGGRCRKTQSQGRCEGKHTGLEKPLVSHIYCIICVFFYLSYLHVCIKYPKSCEVFLVCLSDIFLFVFITFVELHIQYFHFACESGLLFCILQCECIMVTCPGLHFHVYYSHTQFANGSLFMP